MPAPSAILDLVARFGEHIETYTSGSYNETLLRRDFLDPFFKELGWDMDNKAGYRGHQVLKLVIAATKSSVKTQRTIRSHARRPSKHTRRN